MRIKTWLFVSLLCAVPVCGQALDLTLADLPAQVQAEQGNQYTVFNFTDAFSYGFMDIVPGYHWTSTRGLEEFRLIRYHLAPPSGTTVSNNYGGGTTSTPYSGYLWLEAPKYLGQNTLFRVFTDKVSPLPNDSPDYYSPAPTWSFSMGRQAAVTGSASTHLSASANGSGWPPSGDLTLVGHSSCIECGYDVRLNLVGLSYDPNSGYGTLAPADQRALFLEFNDYDPYCGDNLRAFYVQAVPLPGAAWLLSSGLLGLLGLSKRRSR